MKYKHIKENLEELENKINSACSKAGISRDEISLIAVTKTFESDMVNEAISLGINNVAENKVQEIVRKFPELNYPVKKHMIGHLQRNKVKLIIGKVDLIQSVDSIRLLDEIQKQSEKLNLTSEVLIQINIGEEKQKSGVSETLLPELLEHASKLKNIKVRGLMAMAPFFDLNEKTRPYFNKMKKIFESNKKLSYNNINLDILSMGMSNDFEIAIEEGSNMIRIGSAIFGKRDYQ